jgi:hypothetical protein
MNKAILELSFKFKDLKQQSEAQAKVLKDINAEWDECEQALLGALVEEGVNSVKIEGVGNIVMRTENYLSVTNEHKPGFYDYLKASGNGELLKESVADGTLKAFLKQHLVDVQTQLMEQQGLDEITARNEAVKFLNSKGASSHTKRGVSLLGAKK